MHPLLSRFSHRSLLAHAFVLLAAGGLLGACDRHSADDLPESYGHGSGHNKSKNREANYERHETDSRRGSKHFSDSKGLDPEKAKESAPEPTAKPGATDAGRMFPSGN